MKEEEKPTVPSRPPSLQDKVCNALVLVGLLAVIVLGGRSILTADAGEPEPAAALPGDVPEEAVSDVGANAPAAFAAPVEETAVFREDIPMADTLAPQPVDSLASAGGGVEEDSVHHGTETDSGPSVAEPHQPPHEPISNEAEEAPAEPSDKNA